MQKGFNVVNIHGTANAVIAVPVIGENGNWWIGNDDTGIIAHGESGKAGPKGEQGDSAYQTAVKNGFIGTEEEWLESLRGKDGSESGSEAYGMTLLFDGIINKQGEEYELLNDITNFRILLFEVGYFNPSANNEPYGKRTDIILNPVVGNVREPAAQPSDSNGRYVIHSVDGTSLRSSNFYFKTSKILFLINQSIMTAITKIYGIK